MRLSGVARVFVLVVVFAAAILLGASVAAYNWNKMANGYKVVTESYIVVPNGTGGETLSYGNYCSKDGTVLDGGIVCHASTKVVHYTIVERVARSVACFALVILLVLFVPPYDIVFSWRPRQTQDSKNANI